MNANRLFKEIALAGEAEAEKTMLEIEVLTSLIVEKFEHLTGGRFAVRVHFGPQPPMITIFPKLS